MMKDGIPPVGAPKPAGSAPGTATVLARTKAMRYVAGTDLLPNALARSAARWRSALEQVVWPTGGVPSDDHTAAEEFLEVVIPAIVRVRQRSNNVDQDFIDCIYALTERWQGFSSLTYRREVWSAGGDDSEAGSGRSTTTTRRKEDRLHQDVLDEATRARRAPPQSFSHESEAAQHAYLRECVERAKTYFSAVHDAVKADKVVGDAVRPATFAMILAAGDPTLRKSILAYDVLARCSQAHKIPRRPVMPDPEGRPAHNWVYRIPTWWWRWNQSQEHALERVAKVGGEVDHQMTALRREPGGSELIQRWIRWASTCECESDDDDADCGFWCLSKESTQILKEINSWQIDTSDGLVDTLRRAAYLEESESLARRFRRASSEWK